MILMSYNCDAFTRDLAQYLGELFVPAETVRTDEITVKEIREPALRGAVISPGPCTLDAVAVLAELRRRH